MKLVEAQEGRRVLDRLVGCEVSIVACPAHRRRARSAGRVQSVAARLVVERERARMAFRAASLLGPRRHVRSPRRRRASSRSGAALVELDGRRLGDGPRLRRRRPAQLADGATSCSSTRTPRPRSPIGSRDRPFAVGVGRVRPLDRAAEGAVHTSTLQQEAARKLRFSAARTMSVAQRLYERGFITYMRTDSTNLSEQAITAARAADPRACTATSTCPTEPRTYRSKVKNAQEAHEAIRPAGDAIRTADDVGARARRRDERRLYELDLEAHGRVPDGRRARPQGHDPPRARRRPPARRRSFQATGQDDRVPRLPARVRRGCRRPGRRARGPRGDPAAARRGRRGRVPRARARRVTRRSRRRATPKRAS